MCLWVATLKQSFGNEDQSVNTEESIDIPNKAPPFTAGVKFARKYEEGYDLNDSRYEAWLAIEYPNEFNSMHDHQLLTNDIEPSHYTSVSSSCLDTPTFTIEQELKYAARFEKGYDLVDADYEAWRKINHPESTRPNNTHQTMNDSLPFVDASSPLSHSPSVACIQQCSSYYTSITTNKSRRLNSFTFKGQLKRKIHFMFYNLDMLV